MIDRLKANGTTTKEPPKKIPNYPIKRKVTHSENGVELVEASGPDAEHVGDVLEAPDALVEGGGLEEAVEQLRGRRLRLLVHQVGRRRLLLARAVNDTATSVHLCIKRQNCLTKVSFSPITPVSTTDLKA